MGKKKFTSVNTKSAAARERKAEVKANKNSAKAKAKADAAWADEGQSTKEQRKAEKEAKRLAQLAKKAELREKTREQEARIQTAVRGKPKTTSKMTTFQREQLHERKMEQLRQQKEAKALEDQRIVFVEHSEVNMNHVLRDQAEVDAATYAEGVVEAKSVTAALGALSVGGDVQTPKFRVAYKAFCEKRLPELKGERPGLKLSQFKEVCWKEFQKHPDNPHNQPR